MQSINQFTYETFTLSVTVTRRPYFDVPLTDSVPVTHFLRSHK